MNSTAPGKAPRPCGKGAGAEADTVACILLAVRRISALLSCNAECYQISNINVCLVEMAVL